jgi:hypothetical protein
MFASEIHYLRHMFPLWNKLDPGLRGDVMLFDRVKPAADALSLKNTDYRRHSDRAVLVAGWRDARWANNHGRVVLMEHGCGQTYLDGGSYYAGGPNREFIDLFLCPNSHAATANRTAYPDTPCEVVGSPAMDYWHRLADGWDQSIHLDVGLSFHWQPKGGVDEMGSALSYYARILKELNEAFDERVVGHAHPRIDRSAQAIYRASGIPWRTLQQIYSGCGVFCVDNSSVLYEFASLGKPVVVLNAPYMRRDVHHGLRFWEYADVGVQCDSPDNLKLAIEVAMIDPPEIRKRREEISEWLYPWRGVASHRAAQVLTTHLASWN